MHSTRLPPLAVYSPNETNYLVLYTTALTKFATLTAKYDTTGSTNYSLLTVTISHTNLHNRSNQQPYGLTSTAAYFMSMSAPAFVAAYTPPPFIAGVVETLDAVHELFTIIEPSSPLFAMAGIWQYITRQDR